MAPGAAAALETRQRITGANAPVSFFFFLQAASRSDRRELVASTDSELPSVVTVLNHA
jgi:hypothetical protein